MKMNEDSVFAGIRGGFDRHDRFRPFRRFVPVSRSDPELAVDAGRVDARRPILGAFVASVLLRANSGIGSLEYRTDGQTN